MVIGEKVETLILASFVMQGRCGPCGGYLQNKFKLSSLQLHDS